MEFKYDLKRVVEFRKMEADGVMLAYGTITRRHYQDWNRGHEVTYEIAYNNGVVMECDIIRDVTEDLTLRNI